MQSRFHAIAHSTFEAARSLSQLPTTHRAHRLHGHSFRLRLLTPWSPDSDAATEEDRLHTTLTQATRPLDYQLLNQLINEPDDVRLLQWLQQQILLLTPLQLRLGSAPDQGCDLTADGALLLWHHFRFEAAHRLPNVPAGHQCGRMHGHGFGVTIQIRYSLNSNHAPTITLDQLAQQWAPLQQQLDLSCLNEIDGLENPTSEMLAGWIWQKLAVRLPTLQRVTVQETATAGCHFDGTTYRIWKTFQFESALQLNTVRPDDRRRQRHGHSYQLQLQLAAPLDQLLGWTVDYGDVKQLFKPIYRQLDHQQLDQPPVSEDGDLATIAHWIGTQIEPQLPQFEQLDLLQSPTFGIRYARGKTK